MFKKLMMLILLSVISTTPSLLVADVSTTKLNPATKIPNHSTDIPASLADINRSAKIVLASNDVNAIQDLNKGSKQADNASDKVVVSKEAAGVISSISPQLWLILAALCCFVLRSNRQGI